MVEGSHQLIQQTNFDSTILLQQFAPSHSCPLPVLYFIHKKQILSLCTGRVLCDTGAYSYMYTIGIYKIIINNTRLCFTK